MPVIKNFVYCLNTNTTDGKNNILGAFGTMAPEYIPGLFSFSVFFTVLDLEEGSHQLTLHFRDPGGQILATVQSDSIPYEIDASSNLPGRYQGLNAAVNFQNVDIKRSGLHSMEVLLDGESQGAYEIYVKGRNEEREE